MKKYVLVITFLCAFLLSIKMDTLQVSAENSDNEVNLVIHKLLLGDSHTSSELIIENDGSIHPDGLELLQNQVGLNEVEFSIYDVTDDFYELRASGKTVEESQSLLSQLKEDRELVVKGITKTIDSEDGILSVTVPKKQQGKDAVYLIKETNRPSNVKENSLPVVVVLPMSGDEEQELESIHLYIKNDRETPDVPTLEKSIEKKEESYSYGEVITYNIQTTIPQDILQYESYELEDEADPALWLVDKGSKEETIKVSLKGATQTDYYDITELRDHGFTIQFDPQKLGDFVGETISITYEMELRGNQANSNQGEFVNIVELTADNRFKLKDKEKIETGGYHFVKVDMNQSSKKLADAKFVVMNKEKYYLKENKEKQKIWVKDKTQATEFISNEQGELVVSGLRYGDYSLIETQAPTGYILNQQPVSFEVTKDSLQETSNYPLKIVNKVDEKTGQPAPPNKPSTGGNLPKTNEIKDSYLFLVGSLMLIAIVIIKIKGERKHEEN